jgi:hypothetical protein
MISGSLVDAGDSFQIWRVVVNILNKQLQTAKRDNSLAWLLGRRLIIPHHERSLCYEMLHRVPDLDGFLGMM